MLILALGLHLASLDLVRDATLFATAVIAGVPTAIRAFQALRSKAFSIDLLVIIAVTGALIIGEYVEASVVAFLFIFGAWLEARTLEKTRRSLRDLIDMAPAEAQVIRNGETLTVSVDDIAAGETILIHSGGKVPVDGTIISGRGLLGEAASTGESVPVSKTVGATVYTGTILDTGFVHVRAEHVGDDTTFAQIIELVEEAQETKTRAQRFLDRFANIYTPAIVVLSLIVLVFSRNVEFALTFLVIACLGALVISTPVSMVAGLGNGARHGVLVKGGDALGGDEGRQRGAGPDGSALAAQLELASEHPLGRTIVEAAAEQGIELGAPPADVEVIKGGGIRAVVENREVVVGTRKVLATLGSPLGAEFDAYAIEREQAGNTVVFAVIDGCSAASSRLPTRSAPKQQRRLPFCARGASSRSSCSPATTATPQPWSVISLAWTRSMPS